MTSKVWIENYTKGYEVGDYVWRDLCAADKAANVVRLGSACKHDNIVEIGCGSGAILQKLIQYGFGSDWCGLEVSPTALAYAKKHVPQMKPVLYDGTSSPFPDKAFDLVILSHVLEHVEHPRQLLAEAARIGRSLFIEVPLEDTLRLSENYVFSDLGHINYYSIATIRRLVQTCGLKIDAGLICHSSPAVYRYRLGARGNFAYGIKQAALAIPRLATSLWTYHYALLCC